MIARSIIVCVILTITIAQGSTRQCGAGSVAHGSSCYTYVNHTASWPSAQTECVSLGGFLAEPQTSAQNDFIKTLIKANSAGHKGRVWLGATNDQGGEWHWATSGASLTAFDDWEPGQPDNKQGEHCMEYFDAWDQWNDDHCELNKNTFICQTLGPTNQCGAGFVDHGDNCYMFVHQKAVWSQAQKNCESLGGFLAEPQTSDQNDFIKDVINLNKAPLHDGRVWMGASNDNAGPWHWATSGASLTAFEDWHQGQPDNKGGEHCIEYYDAWNQWNDEACNNNLTSICQKPKAGGVVIG